MLFIWKSSLWHFIIHKRQKFFNIIIQLHIHKYTYPVTYAQYIHTLHTHQLHMHITYTHYIHTLHALVTYTYDTKKCDIKSKDLDNMTSKKILFATFSFIIFFYLWVEILESLIAITPICYYCIAALFIVIVYCITAFFII